MKTAWMLGIVVALLLVESTAVAKVAPATLQDLVRRSDFIGVVRVDRVSARIPLIKRRKASATILQSWKGRREGVVRFVAQPTWTCDTSQAKQGEVIVVFMQGDRLALAGRGRMPIFIREDRPLAAVWADVYLPPSLTTDAGPDPAQEHIRAVAVDDLAAAVAISFSTPGVPR